MSISLAISHTPWRQERVVSYDRLIASLRLGIAERMTFAERSPNWIWSEQMWTWAASTGAVHCLFLQDDVIVAPNFWLALRAMLEAVPDQIIGLESVHPTGMTLARKGDRWYTTTDGLIGVGYVMPRDVLLEFLGWRSALKRGAVEAITEDTLIDVFAMATGRRIWHPLPTIIDHDTTLESTYGNDGHSFRRPLVKWSDRDVLGVLPTNLERASFWQTETVQHLGRFYAGSHWLGKQWDPTWTQELHAKLEADLCPEEFGRWV